MDVVKFLGCIGLTLMIVKYASPIQILKTYFRVSEDSKVLRKEWVRGLLQEMLNCAKCTGTWVGAIAYFDFWWAMIIAFASELAYFGLGKLFKTL